MTHRAIVMFSILVLFLMSVGVSAKAGGQAPTSDPAARAVRAFYTYHLAHKKDFNVRNIQLRKRFLTGELYDLLYQQIVQLTCQKSLSELNIPNVKILFVSEMVCVKSTHRSSSRVGCRCLTAGLRGYTYRHQEQHKNREHHDRAMSHLFLLLCSIQLFQSDILRGQVTNLIECDYLIAE